MVVVCSEGSCPVPQSLCRHKNTVLTLLQFLRVFFFLIQCFFFFFFFWPSLPVTLGLEMPSPFLISDHLLLFLPLMLSHTAFLIVRPCSIYTWSWCFKFMLFILRSMEQLYVLYILLHWSALVTYLRTSYSGLYWRPMHNRKFLPCFLCIGMVQLVTLLNPGQMQFVFCLFLLLFSERCEIYIYSSVLTCWMAEVILQTFNTPICH